MKTLLALAFLFAPLAASAATADRMMQDATKDAITHFDKSDVARVQNNGPAPAAQQTTVTTTTTTSYPAPGYPAPAYVVPSAGR